jgi:phosphoribosylamine--glycine ligase
LNDVELVWDKRSCVCVVLTSGGYPGKYTNGYPISGLEEAKNDEGVIVFHAGTKKENGQYVTNGGRV